ncbi:N-formylglutamate amidohydrolase [Thalassobius sp. Cn5-15]|uniref:N-formylglutamate amidohydrolase n=1 Tax=Thalassobius sp. Cn5-15 TaxID=2917763 RepID=UPI001EF2C991|nr:N-formylglutamate amidohydrolase [Thalassobius sp. Cn5-15]MCG7494844.1 N-formylglutamate amidohydrolase [Thalassobius sp. Cn5-15]
MPRSAYEIVHPPKRLTSVVFASPHSGSDYPASFLKRTILNQHSIRTSEDAFVDRLFDSVTQFGAPFLKAGAPRAFVDLNRSEDELDPALITGVRGGGHNPRVASGLGVIPRVVANGRIIYSGKLTLEEAQARISGYYHPYHTALQRLLDESRRMFGEAILIDCHSMPHEAVDSVVRSGKPRPEVVLGDRFGAAADSEIVDRVEAAFQRAGLRVARNAPFAGAYIASQYGRPARRQHAVQVEIDRSLYMNEHMIRPNNNFEAFRTMMAQVAAEVAEIGARPQRLAAE